MDQNRQFWLDWYLLPTDAPFNPSETSGFTTSEEPANDASQQKNAELDAREAELLEKERDLAKREAKLAEQTSDANAPVQNRTADEDPQRPDNKAADEGSQSASRIELLKAENENLKLNLKIQELEEQLKNARKSQADGNARERTNGNAISHSPPNNRGKGQPVVYECGHVAYPPPRKLRYHVVGMLYEGLDEPFELSGRQKATLARHHHHS